MNQDSIPPEAPSDAVLTVKVQNDAERKPDSASTEKLEAQSTSYRRGRQVALMKLAFVRPDNRNPE
jgi:SET domain-containing protein